MIPFSRPSITELEKKYIDDSLCNNILSGDGRYTKNAVKLISKLIKCKNIFLTNSGTDALEMAARLIKLKPGDQVIVPSYTFTSTANAFMLAGAKPVFCDINPKTMNMDENLIESLITPKTKAIFSVAYGGVPCEMDRINEIAKHYQLKVVDDAAQAVGSFYKKRPAGTLSEISCFSFHETKNYIMGEGGAIILSDDKYLKDAEIIREKGTNRQQVMLGMTDKYTWHNVGSSYLPSDILAALLTAQLERFDEIMNKRMDIWNFYNINLVELENKGILIKPFIPEYVKHNAHMFYIILPTKTIRDKLMVYLKENNIYAYFHYIPLHSSPMGKKLGYSKNDLPLTEDYANRLLRLPLFTDMTIADVACTVDYINKFFSKE